MITATLTDTHLYEHLTKKPTWEDSFTIFPERQNVFPQVLHIISRSGLLMLMGITAVPQTLRMDEPSKDNRHSMQH